MSGNMRRMVAALVVLALGVYLPGCDPEGRASGISGMSTGPIPGDPGPVYAELEGDAARALRRYLGANPAPERLEKVFYWAARYKKPRVPLLAKLEWQGETAYLYPAVPLTPGVPYEVVFEGKLLAPELGRFEAEYVVPKPPSTAPARVQAVYPALPEVPANLLKFYVRFSAPISEGAVFRHVRLLDQAGRPVPQAFREVELWADDHQRLTLWINPGRTKQALGLSESLGPVLEANRAYTLEIGAGLTDQKGLPLARPFRHPFRTIAPDHEQPVIDAWAITPPPHDTRQPLRARFPEPLDWALVSRVLTVTSDGKPVPGTAKVSSDGRTWEWTPENPWWPGEYTLEAGGELEDLAGNSLFRPFETVADEHRKPVVDVPTFRRSFTTTGE
jgi:hypothetical protein